MDINQNMGVRKAPETMGQSGSTIGCDFACVAEVTLDDGNALTFGTVHRLPGLKEVSVTPSSETATDYYDDGAGDVATSMGGIEITVSKAFLTVEEEAFLLGHDLTEANGLLVSSAQDSGKSVAFGFRTKLSNGKYAYYWYLKGKFVESENNASTLGESIEFQAQELKGSFGKVNKYFTLGGEQKQPWRTKADGTNTKSASIITTWFDQVVVPTASAGTLDIK